MSKGRSLKLFLVDGIASGIMTVEIGNWSGHILSSPRSRIDAALGRKEVERTGVYILIGEDADGQKEIYIGENGPNILSIPNSSRIISTCGTYLGDNLPEDGYNKYCLDLVCLSGSPVSIKNLEL